MNAGHRQKTILLTGATGYVGGELAPVLLELGHTVRCLVRDADRARRTLPAGVEVLRGDVLSGEGLDAALSGADVAYYLVHSMGRGSRSTDFAQSDRQAARTFGDAVARARVPRTVYLGGLEGGSATDSSEHLRSRHEVADLLRERVPALAYARAAMVVGSGSVSFEILRHLVTRLPLMVTPRWVDTRSQPIAIDDVVTALAALAGRDHFPPEVQLGGADVLTYREMMSRFASVSQRRAPLILRVPVLTPRLSSLWVALFTPVEVGLVRPLVDGLSAETVVRVLPPPGINDVPLGFDDAVRSALSQADRHDGGSMRFAALIAVLAAVAAVAVTLVRRLLPHKAVIRGAVMHHPTDDTTVGADGSVRSVQSADIDLPLDALGELWTPATLERLARTYWAFLSSCTLGLIRMQYRDTGRDIVLLRRPFVLLSFKVPEYEMNSGRGIVRWPIEKGILVARAGRERDGYLEIDVRRVGQTQPGLERVNVEVEVANFYPQVAHWLSKFVYTNTQSRIHVLVTYGFLRRLLRRELDESVTGKFAMPSTAEETPEPSKARDRASV
ncbi:MAG: NAD-dependent epimerase/dehydratase family protein [Solirubrobacterales bacterium]|nr:NAD-dependent epimerase/dehydratase family protein [Solirubrobacterales bacterium]